MIEKKENKNVKSYNVPVRTFNKWRNRNSKMTKNKQAHQKKSDKHMFNSSKNCFSCDHPLLMLVFHMISVSNYTKTRFPVTGKERNEYTNTTFTNMHMAVRE